MNLPRRQAGLTLIEIMVALAISLFLLAGVAQVYLSNKQAYRFAEALARTQETGRFATEHLAREIRMAGYMGCGNLAFITPNIIADNPPPDLLLDIDTALRGVDNAPAGNPYGATVGTDVVTVRRASTLGAYLVGNLNVTNANVQVSHNPVGWVADDILIITDCQDSDVFRATSVSTSGGKPTIAHSTTNNTTNFLSKEYGPGTRVMSFQSETFYVAQNPLGGSSLYWRDLFNTPQELIDGVEDMQVLYGEDTNNDGAPDRYVPAGTVADWGAVRTVRLSLLVTSAEQNVLTEDQVIAWPGNTPAVADRRVRQIFTTTIAVRNRML